MPDGFANSILGGAETLIRSAIKSANYVLGLAGWRISRDGSAELNDATIRGSISAGGNTVLLNAGGVKVDGPTIQMDINIAGAFLVRRVPDDGTSSQLTVFDATNPTLGGGIFGRTQNPSPDGNTIPSRGAAFAVMEGSGVNEQPVWLLRSPAFSGKTTAFVSLKGQSILSGVDDTLVDIDAKTVQIRDVLRNADLQLYRRGQVFEILVTFASSASNTQVFNFPVAFPVGVIPNLSFNIRTTSGTVARFRCDGSGISNTQFTLWSRSGDGTAQAWTNVPVQVTALM